MKIAVYGAGAVGGLMAARLAATRSEVSVVARGASLTAIREHGLRLQTSGDIEAVSVRAEQDPAALGTQDIVVLAVKTTALSAVAECIAPLLGPDTMVVTAMNGVPWWFFLPQNVACSGMPLPVLDPTGALAHAIPLERIIGCVVHLSSSCPEPGLVRRGFGNRLILGEPVGGHSSRLAALTGLLQGAGFEAEASPDIRTEIWYKLWGNMTVNPVSALTGATGDRILADPLVRGLCLAAMQEAAAIGARIGCPIAQSGEARLDIARQLGAFKTSMLQDAQAGRALEIDALIGAVHEIGKQVGVPTPSIDGLLGLVRLYGRSHGLYPD